MPGTDIFCRVIDNFGDIGVCWRLARQLQKRRPNPVRLWVDNLHAMACLEPQVRPTQAHQHIHGIDIMHWLGAPPSDVLPHSLVIEAFACDIPDEFRKKMAQTRSLWINLDYLSAESWTTEWHRLPSLQADHLKKFFFFPGFTPASGGLLRETDLLQKREQWLSSPAQRHKLWQHLGLSSAIQNSLRQGVRLITLFCYPHAPLQELLNALHQDGQPTVILAAQSSLSQQPPDLPPSVQLAEIPFISQDRFDELLWSSDLNFVRGEDSLVRAIWAGKPFLWHIYPQEANAHLQKLDAWLALGLAPSTLTQAWNSTQTATFTPLFAHFLQKEPYQQWTQTVAKQTQQLALQSDLVSRLLEFADEMATTQ